MIASLAIMREKCPNGCNDCARKALKPVAVDQPKGNRAMGQMDNVPCQMVVANLSAVKRVKSTILVLDDMASLAVNGESS